MAKNKLINLLPQEEFEASTVGRVLHWAMGSFRIIVIITEMVVMAAFLSRFWLDAENSDLSDSIKIATSQIKVQAEFEKKFRGIQNKLSIFKQISSEAKASSKIQSLTNKTPQGITISSITENTSTAIILGIATDEIKIAQFISNLRADNSIIKKVDLVSAGSATNDRSSLSFQINITY